MEKIDELKEFARENSVPIVQDGGLEFILGYIKSHPGVKRILEIGTAIAYSAMQFARVRDDILIDTIEFDIDRYHQAVRNVHDENLMDRITVYLGDALRFDFGERKFDLIFIDAAKAQYINYFEHFKHNLSPDGVFISDNLFFHGFVNDLTLTSNYSTIKMIKKLRRFIEFLKYNQEFTTEFHSVGDGLSVSRRRDCVNEYSLKVFSDNIFSGLPCQVFAKDFGEGIIAEDLCRKISFEKGNVKCAFITRLDDPCVIKQADGNTAPDMSAKFSFACYQNGDKLDFDVTTVLASGFVALNYLDRKLDKAIFETSWGDIPVTKNYSLYEMKLLTEKASLVKEANVLEEHLELNRSLEETASDFYADKISLEGLTAHPLVEGEGILYSWNMGKRIFLSSKVCLSGEGKRFLE